MSQTRWKRGMPAASRVVLFGLGLVSLYAAVWNLDEVMHRASYHPRVPPVAPAPSPNAYDIVARANAALGPKSLASELDDLVVAGAGNTEERWRDLTDAQKQRLGAQRLAAERRILQRNARTLALVPIVLRTDSACPIRRSFSSNDYLSKVGLEYGDTCGCYADRTSDPPDLVQLLTIRADVLRQDGDYAAAVDSCLDVFAVASALSRRGKLDDYGTACDLRDAARHELVVCVEHLNAEQAERLGRRLQALLDAKPRLADAWRQQRDYLMAALPACLDRDPLQAAYLPGSSFTTQEDIMPQEVRERFARHDWRVHRDETLHELERCCERAAEASTQPYAQRARAFDELHGVLSQVLAEVSHMDDTFSLPDARERLLRCLFAIQAYRQRTGHLPEALSMLKLRAEYVIDPFTGEPFHYERKGKGYLLFSLGSNGRHHGGREGYDAEAAIGLRESSDHDRWIVPPGTDASPVEHLGKP